MYRLLFWVMLGAFAIGTEGLVIAGMLPALSTDLHVSIAQAGQLVTVFALTYALAAPVLAVLAASYRRESVLRLGMAGFMVANLLAAAAPGFGSLAAARALLAVFAGLYMSAAGAYAAMAVAPERRGRALAFVFMGMAVASVIGVPAGTLLGDALGWRTTFLGVAVLAAVAFAGLCLPRPVQPMLPSSSLAQRWVIVRDGHVLRSLVANMLCIAGLFTAYTYLAPLLQRVAGLSGTEVAWVLMLFGATGVVGNMMGGHLADRRGPDWVVRRAPALLAVLFASISALATWGAGRQTTTLLLVLLAAWGMAGWLFPPAQQLKLVHLAPHAAPVVLSFNASATYLGISLGAVAGSFAISIFSVSAIGWVAAAFEVATLVVVWSGRRRASAETSPHGSDTLQVKVDFP
jgi:predicted MFS family arabinose efflux permease